MTLLAQRIRHVTRNGLFNYILLICIGAFFFIPFLGRVHLFDWDEVNFAEASREMIETNNYMQVTIDYQPFWEKPPLFFWLQVLSMKAFGVNEFAARFVDAAFGILTLLLVYTIGRTLYDRLFGLLWAFAFIGSFLPHLFYKSGVIDPVFNFFIFLGLSLCIRAVHRTAARSNIGLYLAAGVITGLGVLSKGPVAVLIVALCMGVYWASVRFRKFFSWWDIGAFLAALGAVAFLFYGVETLAHGTWFIREFTKYQIRLLTTGDSGQGRPFYFHFLVVLFGCFPASFFAIRSFFTRVEQTPGQRLYNKMMIILFWVVMILFSLVKTKTVLYSSCCYFPVTYLAALHLHGILSGKLQWKKSLGVGLIVFSSLVALAITLFPLALLHKAVLIPLINDRFAVACLAKPVHWGRFDFLLGTGYALALIAAFVCVNRRRFAAGIAILFFSSALCLQAFMIIFAPRVEAYTQGGPIDFYKAHANESSYVRALFKSYADLFYSRKKPGADVRSHDQRWLLEGPIDKPAYFVERVTDEKKFAKENLKELCRAYGYIYLMRDRTVPDREGGISQGR